MRSISHKKYTGILTVEQVAEGVDLCLQNASNLLDDAILLYENGKYARAFSLIVLAEEEMGKIPLVARAIWFKREDATEWRKFWKRFRSHETKYRDALWLDFLFLPEKEIENTLKETQNIPAAVNELKQLGFYVDCMDGRFTLPNVLFKKDLVEFMLRVAKGRVNVLKKIHSMGGGTLETLKEMLELGKKIGLESPKTLDDFLRLLDAI